MSDILSELLSFKGNEIYVERVAGTVGQRLGDINLQLPSSTAIGMVRDGEVLLNPSDESVVQEGDELILIARDDEQTTLQAAAARRVAVPARARRARTAPYAARAGQQRHAQADPARGGGPRRTGLPGGHCRRAGKDASLPDEGELRNVTMELRECKIHKRRVLEALVAEEPTSILLLADPELDDEEADARTLMLQLQLNDIADEIGTSVPLIVEMNSTRNQQLAQMMRATDFVVSSRITAKMMVQVAEERHKKAILNDLLSDGGSSIYMKPITRYVHVDRAGRLLHARRVRGPLRRDRHRLQALCRRRQLRDRGQPQEQGGHHLWCRRRPDRYRPGVANP